MAKNLVVKTLAIIIGIAKSLHLPYFFTTKVFLLCGNKQHYDSPNIL